MSKRNAGWTARLAALVGLCVGGVAATARAADEPLPDKSGYNLFNPTPLKLMRDLNSDRPDVTESPFTVDAGHLQVELSFFEWAKDSDYESLNLLPFNIKLGLTNNVDLQIVYAPYNRLRTLGHTDVGAADVEMRVKINFWGNDGEGVWHTAFGIMPFISFPTGADAFTAGGAEGGIIFPFAVTLPAGFELGAMAEFNFVRDGTGGRDTLLTHTVTLDHKLIGDELGGYIEYAGIVDLDGDQRYQAYFDLGLTYEITKDIQIDCGVNIGLTSAAENLRVFAGLTFRI